MIEGETMNYDMTWCSEENCPHTECVRNMKNGEFNPEPNRPFPFANLKYSRACPLTAPSEALPEEGTHLTLTQIAEKHEIDYQIVYNAVSVSGLLRRHRKGWQYDEKEVLRNCVRYLKNREALHEEKLYEFFSKRQHVEDCLQRLEINDLDMYQK